MKNYTYELLEMYEKSMRIGSNYKWYASKKFVISLFAISGLFMLIYYTPMGIQDINKATIVLMLYVLLSSAYTLFAVRKNNIENFKKLNIPYEKGFWKNKSNLEVRRRRLEHFYSLLLANDYILGGPKDVNKLELYSSLTRNEAKSRYKEFRPLFGLSVLTAFFGALFANIISYFFTTATENEIRIMIFILILISIILILLFGVVSSFKDSYMNYLNKESKKYEKISRWLEIIKLDKVVSAERKKIII